MSEITKCNKCTFDILKHRAKYTGKSILKLNNEMGGVDILEYSPYDTANKDKHFVAWFMELPDQCRC